MPPSAEVDDFGLDENCENTDITECAQPHWLTLVFCASSMGSVFN